MSQLYELEWYAFEGLRVPRVYVDVVPDAQLAGDEPSPHVREKTIVNPTTGKTELFLHVMIRASEATSGFAEFEMPIYAVNQNGAKLTMNTGILKARLVNPGYGITSSLVDGGVMVNGRTTLKIKIPIPTTTTTTSVPLNLTRFELYGHEGCGTDETYYSATTPSPTIQQRLYGCSVVDATYDAPTNLNPNDVGAVPHTLPDNFMQQTNKFHVKSPEEQKRTDEVMKDLPGDVAQFIIGFIPLIGDGLDLGEQLWNTLTGQEVDVVMATLAATGLILDVTTGGVADFTAILKAGYRVSVKLGGVFADAIKEQVEDALAGKFSGEAIVNMLKSNFKNTIDFALDGECGILGIDCFRSYDRASEGFSGNQGLIGLDALKVTDDGLSRSKVLNIPQSCFLNIASEFAQAYTLDTIFALFIETGQQVFWPNTVTPQAGAGCYDKRATLRAKQNDSLFEDILRCRDGNNNIVDCPPGFDTDANGDPIKDADGNNIELMPRCGLSRPKTPKTPKTVKNMFSLMPDYKVRPDIFCLTPHHIVPVNQHRDGVCKEGNFNYCLEAKDILTVHGIDINSWQNIALLPSAVIKTDANYWKFLPKYSKHFSALKHTGSSEAVHQLRYTKAVYEALDEVVKRFSQNQDLPSKQQVILMVLYTTQVHYLDCKDANGKPADPNDCFQRQP
jgi:hypothetical protein